MSVTSPESTRADRPTLHRSQRDHVVFGVCGGLGEYFGIDPVLIRLAFVLITLAGGAGILAYLVLAIVLPAEGAGSVPGTAAIRGTLADLGAAARDGGARGREIAGLILVGLGLLFIAGNLGWTAWINWSIFWPVLLILLGVAVLARHRQGA